MGDFRFDLEFRVNAVSEVDVKSFLSQLNKSTCCTFNISSGRQDKRQYGAKAASSLRGYRKCAHNVATSADRGDKQPGKNTGCDACLNFRLENSVGKEPRAKLLRTTHPLWVSLHFHHNHKLDRAEFLKFLDVSQETRAAYLELFERGLAPSSAHSEMKKNIKNKYPDEWAEMFANQSILPSPF